MALDVSGQADFGGGIYRGRKAPENSVYDAVNALLDDEGNLFRRGGSAYYSDADAGTTLLAVYDEFLQPGQRTVALSATHLYVLNGTTPVDVLTLLSPPTARAASAVGLLFIPASTALIIYGGSLKTANFNGSTVSVTNGSKTVTLALADWSSSADAGMLLQVGTDPAIGVVASVDSATQITLRDPWTGATATGATYSLFPATTTFVSSIPAEHVAAVGTPPRLIITRGNRAYFSPPGAPTTINPATDYHELPDNAQIIGATGVGDTCILFTTAGIWTIENMSLDPVDAAGNVQHIIQQVNKNLILWDEHGLAAHSGGIIVPAIDDVYSFALDQPLSILSDKIRPLYRSYVKAGYQPGLAATHRGHYKLPILSGSTLVDVLTCRIDRDAAPWTRWAGHAAGVAYVERIGISTRAPKLLGVAAQRITDLTGCFDPSTSNAQDGDGSDFDCTIITRDYPTSSTNHPGTAVKARLRYELTDDGDEGTDPPEVEFAWTSDQDGGTFTTLTGALLERAGTAGGGVSDGSKYSSWPVGKMRERIRYRITQTGAAGSFVLRTLEQLTRQGRLR